MMKLSLATRIFVGYAVVLITFGAVSIFSVLELHHNQIDIRLLSQGYLDLAEQAALIDSSHASATASTKRLTYPDELPVKIRVQAARLSFRSRMDEMLADTRERTRALNDFAPTPELPFLDEVDGRLLEVAGQYRVYVQLFNEAAETLAAGTAEPAALEAALASLANQESSIGRNIKHLRKLLTDRIRARVALAEARQRRTHLAIIGLSLLAISVGLIATAFSARSLRPVRTLIQAVSRIGRGDYSAQLGVRGDDEIAQLARAFDGMARSLKEREAQLKDKQEALLRAEQLAAVGRVSAQIAHEVRNPLSSIGLNVELLEEAFGKAKFADDEEATEAKEILRSVTAEVDRLTEVTEHYLRMARMPKPSFAAEEVNEVLGNVLDFSREELERSHVEVVRKLDPGSPRALADEGQLRQVFLNLLRNSREAMRDGGKLVVESRQTDGHVEVVFADSGRGMTEEVQQRIFEPFFSTKDGGTGLGLAVSRQILQSHGGSIACRSAPGEGTTFVVRLPAA